MDGSAFSELFAQYITPGLTLNPQDLNECLRLVTSVCYVLNQRVSGLLRRHAERPLMYVYQNDGWASWFSSYRCVSENDIRLRAQGRIKAEFCLERGIIRARKANGFSQLTWLIGPPRAMKYGRGAWNFFAAGMDFYPTLRSLGHKCIAITVYIFDGAMFDPLKDMFRARHEVYYDPVYGTCPLEEKEKLYNTELVIPIYCTLHGSHKGCEWGLNDYNEHGESDEGHIAIASLLNSSESLHDTIDTYISKYVCFEDRNLGQNDVRAYWMFVEVPATLLDSYVLLDPDWNPSTEQLIVNGSMRNDPRLFLILAIVILGARRWIKYSDTRWGRAGRAGRFFFTQFNYGNKGPRERHPQ